jgi:hypothetical protein
MVVFLPVELIRKNHRGERTAGRGELAMRVDRGHGSAWAARTISATASRRRSCGRRSSSTPPPTPA